MSKVLNSGFVEVYDVYGSDLTTVNAARVSFGKLKEKFDEKDAGLIKYLADHEHTSPFRQTGIVFHMKMPIFVMRQFIRHGVGVAVNEISGRYVEFEEDFYIPDAFRKQSTNNKQGSEVEIPEFFPHMVTADDGVELEVNMFQSNLVDQYVAICRAAFNQYKRMCDMGVAKEMARMCLPLSTYTEFMAYMSLQSVAHFCRLRNDSHAQKEIMVYSNEMERTATELFPHSFKALMESGRA